MFRDLLLRAVGFGHDGDVSDQLVSELSSELEVVRIEPQPTILDKSATIVSGFLESARSEEARLVKEIDAMTERLRQTRVAIAAFEPTLKALDYGYDPAPDVTSIDAKRRRGERQHRKSDLVAAE